MLVYWIHFRDMMEMPVVSDDQTSVHNADTSFNVHKFSEDIFGNRINFVVLKMDSTCFIWIGDEMESFHDLNLAMMSRFQTTPIGSKIMGDHCELTSLMLSQKICRKLSKPVYLSCNIKDSRILSEIEKRICKEISDNIAAF